MPRLRQRKILGFATCLMSIVDQISCMEGAWRTMHMRKYSKKFHLSRQRDYVPSARAPTLWDSDIFWETRWVGE